MKPVYFERDNRRYKVKLETRGWSFAQMQVYEFRPEAFFFKWKNVWNRTHIRLPSGGFETMIAADIDRILPDEVIRLANYMLDEMNVYKQEWSKQK